MKWRLRRVVPAAAVTTHAKSHAQQQLARDLEVERAVMGQRCRPRRGAARQSAATPMAGFLLNFSSAALELETKAESEPPTSLAGNLYGVDGLGKIWFAHARASVCTLLLHAPGLVSCVRQHASCHPCT